MRSAVPLQSILTSSPSSRRPLPLPTIRIPAPNILPQAKQESSLKIKSPLPKTKMTPRFYNLSSKSQLVCKITIWNSQSITAVTNGSMPSHHKDSQGFYLPQVRDKGAQKGTVFHLWARKVNSIRQFSAKEVEANQISKVIPSRKTILETVSDRTRSHLPASRPSSVERNRAERTWIKCNWMADRSIWEQWVQAASEAQAQGNLDIYT